MFQPRLARESGSALVSVWGRSPTRNRDTTKTLAPVNWQEGSSGSFWEWRPARQSASEARRFTKRRNPLEPFPQLEKREHRDRDYQHASGRIPDSVWALE